MSVQSVLVYVSCPACGARDYEFDFSASEVERGTQVSVACDECDKRIAVDIDVHVQAVAP